jgi:hypothetical protein
MTKYTISFACSRPGEPGCGCPDGNFLGEHGFEGTAEEAVREAQRLDWEKYRRDFSWWIDEDPNAEIKPEKKEDWFDVLEKLAGVEPHGPQKLSERLKYYKNVKYHESKEELDSIFNEPAKTSITIFPPGVTGDAGSKHLGFHCIDFDLYNNDILVCRGTNYPRRSGSDGVSKSCCTVKEMIYGNLAYKSQVSHVCREDGYSCFQKKDSVDNNPTMIDVYRFEVDKALEAKYVEKHIEACKEKELEFRSICERLKIRGTTL